MKLKIEDWISNQKLSKRVTILFDESTKCYKASAYRASLLFSYLGFMTVIKDRMLNSQPPPGLPQSYWNKLVKDLNNREGWDKIAFEATQMQKPAPMFLVSDTIRREVMYWKDRRNDCAHFKHENIEYHHVESFWSFLETNLSKFAVNGGSDALLRKFKAHFDPALTHPDESIVPLINEIQNAVDPNDLRTFFSSIELELTSRRKPKFLVVFNAILDHYEEGTSDELIAYLKADEDKLINFIRSYPEKIPFLNLSARFIRSLWFDKLFSDFRNDFNIYASLLRNSLISKRDIPTANDKVIHRLTSQVPTLEEQQVLMQHRFYLALKERLFPEGGIYAFAEANSVSSLIIHYIETFSLDESIVDAISGTFSQLYTPNELEAELRRFFDNNPDEKIILDEIVKKSAVKLPKKLSFLKVQK